MDAPKVKSHSPSIRDELAPGAARLIHPMPDLSFSAAVHGRLSHTCRGCATLLRRVNPVLTIRLRPGRRGAPPDQNVKT